MYALDRITTGVYHSNHVDKSIDMDEIYYPCGGVYKKYINPPKTKKHNSNTSINSNSNININPNEIQDITHIPITVIETVVEEEDIDYIVNDD